MEIKRVLKVSALVLAAVLVVSSVAGYLWVQSVLHKDPVYETKPPVFPADFGTDGRPAVLVFSKTNGFRHEDAIPAAREMLNALGAERGWSLFHCTRVSNLIENVYLKGPGGSITIVTVRVHRGI